VSTLLEGGDVESIESVTIALNSAQMNELRREGRLNLNGDDGLDVTIGHEDAVGPLSEEGGG